MLLCRLGSEEGTRFATNTRLVGQKMLCKCKKKHVQLRGRHPVSKIPGTAVAQPYPKGGLPSCGIWFVAEDRMDRL